MNKDLRILLSRLKFFSCLISSGFVFMFNIFFPEIEYYGSKMQIDLLSIASTFIGLAGLLMFIKCPKCNKKLLFELINKEHNLDFPSWEYEVRNHKCFNNHNDKFQSKTE